MKVKELIKLLKDLPPNHEVILSKDGEGNGYSPLSNYSDEIQYVPESTYAGEIRSKEDFDYLKEEGAIDEGEKFKPNAIVLWPTN